MMKSRVLEFAVVAVVLGALIAGAAVHAQNQPQRLPGIPQLREARGCLVEAMKAAGVSDQQMAEMKAIRERYAPQIRDIKNSTLPPVEKRQKIAPILKQMHQEVQAVLSDSQRQQIRIWMRDNCSRKPHNGQWAECLKQALQAAGVAPEQAEHLREINQKYSELMRELRLSDLTPEQKREEFKKLAEQRRAETQGVVTPEQQRAIRQWMQDNCQKPSDPQPQRPRPLPSQRNPGQAPVGPGVF